MPSKSVREERTKTAEFRFYLYYAGKDVYPHCVSDAAQPQGDKIVARFKESHWADTFLQLRRKHYIETGE